MIDVVNISIFSETKKFFLKKLLTFLWTVTRESVPALAEYDLAIEHGLDQDVCSLSIVFLVDHVR